MQKPIVATPIGAEGIDCTHGENILLESAPTAFAESICRLFADAELRRHIGEAGRATVEAQYDWAVLARRVEGFYRKAVENARQRIGE